jgi:protein AATF/BFR2
VEKAALAAAAANAAEGRHVVEQLAEQREAAKEKYKELQASIEDALATLYAAATGTSAAATAEADDGDEVTGVSGSSTVRKSAKRAKVEAAAPVVPSYRAVEKYHERALHHADSCLEYWGSKLVQANSAKLKTISQPLPQQIAAILTARTRLRTKVQKNRSHLNILAHPEHVRASTSPEVKARRALHIAEGDVDAEVYDDGDFVRELVRRGGAVASQLEQKVKEMRQALLPSREGARKGFHRMTKGKAVNYEPRPKLVGFMMAESLDDTPRNDVVVKSLFQ